MFFKVLFLLLLLFLDNGCVASGLMILLIAYKGFYKHLLLLMAKSTYSHYLQ
ncbi:hypothetical protein PLUTE_a2202 [Pseudoalteromonas luteoviolacea DSM 6061]|nr:hypothetical protein [Pseudoalteromonas luteoviolacea DSM 6061]